MGICQKKITYYKEVASPTTTKDHKIQRIYGPMVSIEHKDNINKKYDYLMDINDKLFTNEGIVKTNQFDSKVDKTELEKQINEFWGNLYEKPEWTATRTAGTLSASPATLKTKVII